MRWSSIQHSSVILLWVLSFASSACVSAVPRFPDDVQTAVSRADMQRIETQKLILYYPKQKKEEALRIAGRLEYCRNELEKLTLQKHGPAARKSIFVLPEIPYNNAFVAPPIQGLEQVALLPQYNTASYFLYFGMPPDPSTIGCHEMVHDVVSRQIGGKAKGLHYAFGRGSFSPQVGFEPWFHEGIAVYYETKLQGRGRMWTKYFEGVFAAGIQEQSIHGGLLNYGHRKPLFGAQYLVGSHFIDYLARTYGEDALWEVVFRQSRSIAPFLGVGVRFKRAYGKSLSELIDEFEVYARQRFGARKRPASQTRVRQLGTMAVVARSLDGHVATVTQDLDQPVRLLVHAPDGQELVSRRLTDVGFGRRLISPSAFGISGLSLTADGRHVYFVSLDSGPVFSESRLVHLDVPNNRLTVIARDLVAAGGSISPDGKKFYFSRPQGDSAGLHVYDVDSGTSTQLTKPPAREYHESAFASPDGTKLVVLEASMTGIRAAIYNASTGERLGPVVAPEGPLFQPSWRDDHHVVYLASDSERMQVFETDLTSGRFRRLTDAPYVAGAPFADGKKIHFLNREGWKWTFDEASYAGASPWFTSSARPMTAASEHPRTPDVSSAEQTLSQAPEAAASESDIPTPEEVSEPVAATNEDPRSAAEVELPTDEPPNLLPVPKAETTSHAYWSHREALDVQPKLASPEEDYSAFDGFFFPQAWGPWITQRPEGQSSLGASATGGDRLGLHRWALGAGWDLRSAQPSGVLSYINTMGAPYILTVDAAYIGRSEAKIEGVGPLPKGRVNIQEVIGSASLRRSWYASHSAEIGARYVSARYEFADGGYLIAAQRFAGPMIGLSHSSDEYTPYSGRRLAFDASTVATYFPEALSKASYTLIDLRSFVGVTMPLPLSKRHTLRLAGRARGLLGAPTGQNLLEVGGGGNSSLPLNASSDAGLPSSLPPGLRFYEPLRGFEDDALLGRRVVMGDATYTYPFVIDWGMASALRFLPSIFLRQIDFQLFFASASLLEQGREVALAAGAALNLRMMFWQTPLSFGFQESRRLTYDEDFAFFFRVGLGV